MAEAMETIMSLARRANKYIDETTPWVLGKDEAQAERLATVLYNLLETIRFIGVILAPFMPETSAKILEEIGTKKADFESVEKFGALEIGNFVGEAVPLFARIDAEKFMAEAEAKMAAQKAEAEKEDEVFEVPELASEIAFDDFMKVDLRVALVKECEKVKKSKKLLCLQLDDGMGGRQVVSGIAQWYEPSDLIGKKVILVANLKPVTLCGVESKGMIVAGDTADGDAKVIFPDQSLPCGSKIH